ncbi:MAG: hypothetical protein ACKO34_06840, partial [Vampirovibrionales bacterium]
VLPKDGRLVSTSTQGSLAIAQGATATVSLRNDKANTIEFGGNREDAPGSTTTILVGAGDRIKTKLPLGGDQAISVDRSIHQADGEWAFTLLRGKNSMTIKAKTLDQLKSIIKNSDIDGELKTKLLKGVDKLNESSSSSSKTSDASTSTNPPKPEATSSDKSMRLSVDSNAGADPSKRKWADKPIYWNETLQKKYEEGLNYAKNKTKNAEASSKD